MAKPKPKEHQKPSYPTKRNQTAVAQQRRTSWWTDAPRENFSALAERQTVDVKDVRPND